MGEADLASPATKQLAALIEGRLAAESWLESAQRTPLRSRAA
jgi:hypothetical protein